MSTVEDIGAAVGDSGLLLASPVLCRPGELHGAVAAADVPAFANLLCDSLGAQLVLIAADDRRAVDAAFHVHYTYSHPADRWIVVASVRVHDRSPSIPSLAATRYPASRFEREMQDLFGLAFAGHPDPRPLVRHGFWPADFHPLRRNEPPPLPFADDGRPFPFKEVEGDGIYEIPVGPVHAGVIEPGHFRFSVMGETIIRMKSRLFFTHKGTEKLFEGRAPEGGVELAERISGDTSVGHALAFCEAIECATGTVVPRRARLIRVVLLELERLYNHVADFGMIANDTGFAVAQAHCSRIREQLLRLNKQLFGTRLLRGMLVPGGVLRAPAQMADGIGELRRLLRDFEEVAAICTRNTLVMDRFEGTGVLPTDAALDYGVLGYVARASGIDRDVRRDRPFAAYDEMKCAVPVMSSGDVKARALVRLEEARQAVSLVEQAARALPLERDTALAAPRLDAFEPYQPAFGMVEGWRGRIVHMVMFAPDGRLHRVKIVDPSFFNWPALSRALADNIVPDFPLCNKSFNQSYSGNDL